MIDDLENLITQSIDGLLSPEQQAQVDAELARNPAALAMRDEYAALDAALKRTPLPNLNFEILSQRISQAVDESDGPAPIFVFPAWSKWSVGTAAAACIVLTFTVWGHHSAPAPTAIAPVNSSTQVAIMDAGAPINRQPIASVAIGPEPGQEKTNLPAREALTTPRSAVAIDSAAPPAQDNDRPLY
jgi:anti-sigma factor RsiW